MNTYEPGRYSGLITKQGFGVERSGTEFFFLTVQLRKRLYDDYSEDCEDYGLRDVKLHLTEKTIDFQLEVLRGLGWGGTDFEDLYSGSHSFVGQELEVSCEVREYKGRYYDQFSVYRSSTKEAPKSAVSGLTAKFAAKLKETATDAPKRAQPEHIDPEDPHRDIPF